jgi:hypothetical protein
MRLSTSYLKFSKPPHRFTLKVWRQPPKSGFCSLKSKCSKFTMEFVLQPSQAAPEFHVPVGPHAVTPHEAGERVRL